MRPTTLMRREGRARGGGRQAATTRFDPLARKSVPAAGFADCSAEWSVAGIERAASPARGSVGPAVAVAQQETDPR